jgi:hypothetical protein
MHRHLWNPKFTPVFPKCYHRTPSWASWIQHTHSQSVPLISVLILSSPYTHILILSSTFRTNVLNDDHRHLGHEAAQFGSNVLQKPSYQTTRRHISEFCAFIVIAVRTSVLQHFVRITAHAYRTIPRPYHQPTNTRCKVQIMKLLAMHFSTPSSYCPSL